MLNKQKIKMVWCNYNCSAPESKLGKMWRCPECNKRLLVHEHALEISTGQDKVCKISKHKRKVKEV